MFDILFLFGVLRNRHFKRTRQGCFLPLEQNDLVLLVILQGSTERLDFLKMDTNEILDHDPSEKRKRELMVQMREKF